MDELANVLGIIVDGGTVLYVGYKAGRWTWESREQIREKIRLVSPQGAAHKAEVTDGLRITDQVRVEVSTTVQATPSMRVIRQRESKEPSAVEELLWWYLRARFS